MKSYAQRMKKPQIASLQQSPTMGASIGNQTMGALMGYDASKSKSDPALEDKMRAKLQKQFSFPKQEAHREPGGVPLPPAIQKEYEEKSGVPLDDVRVHYNSDKPSNFGALAYTHGSNVYLGSGQEEHLNHEVTHVVQQKQGVVRPTGSIDGIPVNTTKNMEHRADTSDVTWASVPLYDNVGEPVMQMKLPQMQSQAGNNCGFHALARVLLELGAFNNVNDSADAVNPDQANELTSYAVKKNLTATGEAFDPEVLVETGNLWCKDKKADIQCETVSFSDKTGLSELFNLCRNNRAKILFPYNTGNEYLPVETNALGAHWAAIDTESTSNEDKNYDLYEGNVFGIKGERSDPANVTIEELFNSNQSISDKFDWKTFYSVSETLRTGDVESMRNDYSMFRDKDKPVEFRNFDDFSETLKSIKNPTDGEETYADGKEKVNLKGKAIVIAKNGDMKTIMGELERRRPLPSPTGKRLVVPQPEESK